ncbi:hypothetical protein [Romboutsia sp.]|uniref:hypothetical protein n=1 Tax=Romboutsia sp. TaxID=1965302 RepID=UPI002B8EB644|nr:hypothetical protein [Romboutsia sp.]HSQ87951.1 hypothetical protein [Romboutsia sp.]
MGFKDKFAESFARSKTMTGPEKKANEIMGKLLMQKAIVPIVLMVIVLIGGIAAGINSWILLGVNLLIAVGTYFYIKKAGDKYQNFKPYIGNLISLEKKGKNEYVAIIKQGKMPIKLEINYGGEDLVNIKRNQLVQISYNPDAKIAILVTK